MMQSNLHVESQQRDDTIRQWRQLGFNFGILDLKCAYLHHSLWTYQVVRYKVKTFLLTKLGFGLTTALSIMTTIVETIIKSDNEFVDTISIYIDDIFIDCSRVDPFYVKNYFEQCRLMIKDIVFLGSSPNKLCASLV